MKIRWIGQSGYVISCKNTSIVIDPYLSDAVNRIAGRPRLVDAPIAPESITADAVVCTHDHIDHLDPDSVVKMPKETRFITTASGCDKLKELGQCNVQAIAVGESVTLGELELTAVFADHTTEAFGLIVRGEGNTLYFSGDTLYNEKLFEIAEYKPDITFICINGKLGNMNTEEAVKTAKMIGAEVNVPNHYGMFASNTADPRLFCKAIKGSMAMEFNKDYTVGKLLRKDVPVPARREVFRPFEDHKEYMDTKVSCGIELYRKGYGKITVKTSGGELVPNARITLSQKDHEFKFGANIFMLDEFETEEKNKAYRELFKDTFNMATLPFYWNATEPKKGETRYTKDSPKMYRRPPIDLCMEYCEENGIEPREHGLAYNGFFPSWLKNASVYEAKCALENRYKEIAERYAHRIPTIEVTNEMEWPWHGAKTAFYNQPDFIEWCFKTAEKYFPCNTLCINELGRLAWDERARATDRYYAYIDAAIQKGARIDAIGAQFHSYFKKDDEIAETKNRYDVLSLYRHMDSLAQFGKRIHLTEVSLPSYSYEEEDEAIQADLLEKLYSIWFSHPAVDQIVYWNLVDGYAHGAKIGDMLAGENIYRAGLVRFDMTPKPAYYRLKELIQKKWHTETETETNENGIARFRGFYGNYKATVTVNGETTEAELPLMRQGVNEFVIVL